MPLDEGSIASVLRCRRLTFAFISVGTSRLATPRLTTLVNLPALTRGNAQGQYATGNGRQAVRLLRFYGNAAVCHHRSGIGENLAPCLDEKTVPISCGFPIGRLQSRRLMSRCSDRRSFGNLSFRKASVIRSVRRQDSSSLTLSRHGSTPPRPLLRSRLLQRLPLILQIRLTSNRSVFLFP